MWIKMKTPTFYYIDPTQTYIAETWDASAHDGSSVAKADRALPDTLQDGVCYLIRRCPRMESDNSKWCVPTKAVTMTSGDYVAIVGMPKSDDDLYKYMPEDAKTEWGADSDDKAILGETSSWGNAHLITINCRHVFLYNLLVKSVWRHRGSNNESENGVYGYFNITGEFAELVKVENTIQGNDLSKGDDCQAYWNTMYCEYYRLLVPFKLNMSTGATITDSIFQRSIPLYSIGLGCVDMSESNPKTGFVFKNITVYNTTIRYNGGLNGSYVAMFVFPAADNYRKRYTVSFDTLHEYIFSHKTVSAGNTMRIQSLFSGGAYNNIHINNVTIEMNENQFGRTEQPWFAGDTHIDVPCFGGGSVIENITCNLPKLRGNVNLIKMYEANWAGDSNRYLPKSQWYILKNIIANFCPADAEPVSTGGDKDNSIINAFSQIYSDYNNRQNTIMTCRQIIVQNIAVTAPKLLDGYAVNFGDAMIDMIGNTIQGRGKFTRCTGKIGEFSTYGPGNAVTDGDSNLLYIKKITCNKNNPDSPYTGQQALTPTWASHILVGETNTLFLVDDYVNGVGNNNLDCMYACTSNSIKGNFTVRNAKCKVETWSVNRTGGHPCTLRFLNEYGDASNAPIIVGGRPFAGLKKHLSAGKHKLTFYVTTYGYNDPSLIETNMLISAKIGTEQVFGGGHWESDTTTTWNNIELNTSFKYTMYIELAKEADVEFVYTWWMYMKNAYTYIDPFPDDEVIE